MLKFVITCLTIRTKRQLKVSKTLEISRKCKSSCYGQPKKNVNQRSDKVIWHYRPEGIQRPVRRPPLNENVVCTIRHDERCKLSEFYFVAENKEMRQEPHNLCEGGQNIEGSVSNYTADHTRLRHIRKRMICIEGMHHNLNGVWHVLARSVAIEQLTRHFFLGHKYSSKLRDICSTICE